MIFESESVTIEGGGSSTTLTWNVIDNDSPRRFGARKVREGVALNLRPSSPGRGEIDG